MSEATDFKLLRTGGTWKVLCVTSDPQ